MVLAIGLAALVIAMLRDRITRRRAELAAGRRAAREIPGLDADAPLPHYVPAGHPSIRQKALAFTTAERATVEQWRASASRIEASLAGDELATHLDPPTAIQHDVTVLVCPEGVGSMRELLPTAERAVREHRALLVAASAIDADVVETLAVNQRAGRLAGCAVIADADACAALCAATGASPVSRADLQSGYVPHAAYGHAARVVSDATATWIGASDD